MPQGTSSPHAAQDVDVWFTDHRALDDRTVAALEWALSEEERDRCRRLRAERFRRENVVSRALLRQTLSRYEDVPPSAWAFSTNRHGRPEVSPSLRASARALRFSLSHTEGLSICAVTRAGEVGVDAEYLGNPFEVQELADRFFAPSESRALRALSGAARDRLFFSHWTLKEAYLKARGTGLSLPLDACRFELGGPGEIRFDPRPGYGDSADGWDFLGFDPTPMHRASVAVKRPGGGRARFRVWATAGSEVREVTVAPSPALSTELTD